MDAMLDSYLDAGVEGLLETFANLFLIAINEGLSDISVNMQQTEELTAGQWAGEYCHLIAGTASLTASMCL